MVESDEMNRPNHTGTGTAEEAEESEVGGPRVGLLLRVLTYNELAEDVAGLAPLVFAPRTSRFDAVSSVQSLMIGRASEVSQALEVRASPVGHELLIPDRHVSSQHARCTYRQGVVIVEDGQSKNGSWVQGERLTPSSPRRLVDRDIVEFGRTMFCFRELPETVAREWLELGARCDGFGPTHSQCHELLGVASRVKGLAASPLSLMIRGETGTGKEELAQAIVQQGPRARGPFLPVNCSAIPEALAESFLFGHVKGGFTGAVSRESGVLVEASGGTVFLDEIGDMPLSLQPKLLRAVQQRTVFPVGSSREVPFDVRFLSATHASMDRLRADLVFRLAELQITLPPLRARREDLGILSAFILKSAGVSSFSLEPARGRRLFLGHLGANIRELRARLLHYQTGGDDESDGEISTPAAQLDLGGLRRAGRQPATAEELLRALRTTDGKQKDAAEKLGYSARHVRRIAAKLGVPASGRPKKGEQ